MDWRLITTSAARMTSQKPDCLGTKPRNRGNGVGQLAS